MKKIIWALAVAAAFSSCRKDDIPRWEPVVTVNGGMTGKVRGIPDGVFFDRISVEISGFDWQTIATIEAFVQDGTAQLILPTDFAEADLQPVDRGANGRNMEGYWPSVSSDPRARVATMRDEILAWDGDRRVGRIYLTDWSGDPTVSMLGKRFIGWQFADRPFVLDGFTGRNDAFTFRDCPFAQGWNAFAKINASRENIRISTDIPADAALGWRFELWP